MVYSNACRKNPLNFDEAAADFNCTHTEEREPSLTCHRCEVNLPTSVPVSCEQWNGAGAKNDSIYLCAIHLRGPWRGDPIPISQPKF